MNEPITRDELERELTHLRELLGERDKALIIQAREYERRLDLLKADQRARAAQLMAWIFAWLAALSTVFTILRYWR